ncbi:MAG: hypothetical protein ACREVE_08160 [Gammaproteobacteria bacterium]
MISIAARTTGLAALLALTMTQVARAEPVQPGVEYPGGTKVEPPGQEVSFTIPEGWKGILPQGATFFVMGSEAQKSYVFVIVDKLTQEKAMANMKKPLELGNGLTLQLNGNVQQQEDTLTGSYDVVGAGKPLKGYVETLVGKRGTGVSYVAIGAPETAASVVDVVHTLVENTALP